MEESLYNEDIMEEGGMRDIIDLTEEEQGRAESPTANQTPPDVALPDEEEDNEFAFQRFRFLTFAG